MTPVGPRSWTALRRPSKAPALTAASRSVGSLAPTLASRIEGQPFGVRRIVVIGSVRLRAGRLSGSCPAPTGKSGVEAAEERGLGRSMVGHGGCLDAVLGPLEAEMAVIRGRPVDHRVPGACRMADPLERGHGEVTVGGLGRLEDLEHLLRVEVVVLEDSVDRVGIDPLEMGIRRIRDRPAGPPQWTWKRPFVSMPPMSMHSIGQACAHWKQVSHFSAPYSSYRSCRRPRNLCGMSGLTSGYLIVAFGSKKR